MTGMPSQNETPARCCAALSKSEEGASVSGKRFALLRVMRLICLCIAIFAILFFLDCRHGPRILRFLDGIFGADGVISRTGADPEHLWIWAIALFIIFLNNETEVGIGLRDAWRVSLSLCKAVIPIIIAVKALTELNLMAYIAKPLEPIMGLAGLPADLGLVWATALCVNVWSGVALMLSMLPSMPPLTVAQMSVFAAMLLLAHSFPLEGRIAARCGVNMLVQFCIRFPAALLYGFLLHWIYTRYGLLDTPATPLLTIEPTAPGLLGWGLDELIRLAQMFVTIFLIFLCVTVLKKWKIINLLQVCLLPVLKFLRIGKETTTITVIGMTTGIIYGSGLIIREAQKGAMSGRDLFAAMSLMGLAHSLLDDTIIMLLMGADFTSIFWPRIALALALTRLLMTFYDMRLIPGMRKHKGMTQTES